MRKKSLNKSRNKSIDVMTYGKFVFHLIIKTKSIEKIFSLEENEKQMPIKTRSEMRLFEASQETSFLVI